MKTKSFYSKPTVKIVKIDHVHLLNESIEPYVPGGSGQGQSVPEVPVNTETEQ
jgi:hypothetical protein